MDSREVRHGEAHENDERVGHCTGNSYGSIRVLDLDCGFRLQG